MATSVVNLDSPFDWVPEVRVMLAALHGERLARALGMHADEALFQRKLDSLGWVFLVSRETLAHEARMAGAGDSGDRDDRDERRPWDWPIPFERDEGDRSMQEAERPSEAARRTAGGGIIELAGMYVADLDGYLRELGKRSQLPQLVAAIAPPGTRLGSAVFLCPEKIFAVPYALVKRLRAFEPRPPAAWNLTELFLRMVLFHEIGHHVLPGPEKHDPRTFHSEFLANTLCHALLTPDERPWLYAKAYLLQPAPYLAFAALRALEGTGLAGGTGEFVREQVRCALSGSSASPRPRLALGAGLAETPLIASPELLRALNGLLRTVGHSRYERLRPSVHTPCALTAFEEYALERDDPAGLTGLLSHPETSVQAAVFSSLDRRTNLTPEDRRRADRWCDANLSSPDLRRSLAAWRSAHAHREADREARYAALAETRNHVILAELPERVRSGCGAGTAERLLVRLARPPVTNVGYFAVKALARLYATATPARDADYNRLLMRGEPLQFSTVWRIPERSAVRIHADILLTLASGSRLWVPAGLTPRAQAEARRHILAGMLEWNPHSRPADALIDFAKHARRPRRVLLAALETLDPKVREGLLEGWLSEKTPNIVLALLPAMMRRFGLLKRGRALRLLEAARGVWCEADIRGELVELAFEQRAPWRHRLALTVIANPVARDVAVRRRALERLLPESAEIDLETIPLLLRTALFEGAVEAGRLDLATARALAAPRDDDPENGLRARVLEAAREMGLPLGDEREAVR